MLRQKAAVTGRGHGTRLSARAFPFFFALSSSSSSSSLSAIPIVNIIPLLLSKPVLPFLCSHRTLCFHLLISDWACTCDQTASPYLLFVALATSPAIPVFT
ncbi:hypothetical protein BDW75DRAFT_12244 [Aspergillus navahoensis]